MSTQVPLGYVYCTFQPKALCVIWVEPVSLHCLISLHLYHLLSPNGHIRGHEQARYTLHIPDWIVTSWLFCWERCISSLPRPHCLHFCFLTLIHHVSHSRTQGLNASSVPLAASTSTCSVESLSPATSPSTSTLDLTDGTRWSSTRVKGAPGAVSTILTICPSVKAKPLKWSSWQLHKATRSERPGAVTHCSLCATLHERPVSH